jgi:(p)ppGpp synthase/HD superfamily hydrolase
MMTKEEFLGYRDKYQAKIEKIRQRAYELHENVNQIYGDDLPYGFHLDMVAEGVEEFGHLVCVREEDVLPIFFGAFFHDTIEDARQTYNDVMKEARKWLSEEQALMATEIVYALTNDKGRTRAERAGEKYYKGIRETPYATFVKLCDRLANVTYTCSVDCGKSGFRMKETYKSEMRHFLPALKAEDDDPRKQLPYEVVLAMAEVLIDEVDRDEVRRQWGEY